MENAKKDSTDATFLMGEWLHQVMGFWDNMAKSGAEAFTPRSAPGKAREEKIFKNWEAGAKMFQSLMMFLGKPETIEGMLKGLDAAPDVLSQLARQSWEGYFDIQKQWMERASKVGTATKAYSFEDIDQDTFRAIRELYEKEFRKFLHVPQLGLTRFYQEKFNRLIDSHNLFQTALSEFLYMFYVPIEKTAGVMQEKLEEMVEAGEIHDDFKAYYNMWIKILEGHYMTLLKSPEYAEVMDKTIEAFVDYKSVKEDFLCDLLQNLPVPTNRDMDALYKEFHILKRKVRELSRMVDRQLADDTV